MPSVVLLALLLLLALAASADQPPPIGKPSTKDDEKALSESPASHPYADCVTLKKNVNPFDHRLDNLCDGTQVIVEWESDLHGKRTSNYRLMHSYPNTPWSRNIYKLDAGATVHLKGFIKLDDRCTSTFCPKENRKRIKIKTEIIDGTTVYRVDNSTGNYVYVKAQFVENEGTPNERTLTSHGVFHPLCYGPGCRLYATPTPPRNVKMTLVTADEELR